MTFIVIHAGRSTTRAHTHTHAHISPHLQLLCYTMLTGMGYAAIWRQPWLQDTQQYWQGWPNHEFT
jgi:hypothetical protein